MPAIVLPGADRVETPRILRGAYRDAREWKALATIGARAYPFKKIAAGYLAGEHPEGLRVDALNVLAAMGPAARDVLPRVEALADGEGIVAAAAKRARDALKGP